MKNVFKKALSVFLATLMCLMVAPVFAFAADEATTPEAPVFSLEVKSETAAEVAVVLILKEGAFNNLDMTITACEHLTLTKISFNAIFFLEQGAAQSSNIANGKISFANPETIATECEIVTYTYTKAETEAVTAANFEVLIDACGIGDSASVENNTDVTAATVVNNNVAHTHKADGDWKITVEPTCEGKGTKVRYCAICNEVAETAEIASTGHLKTTTTRTEPTCTVAGVEKIVCDECGKTLKTTTIDPTNHKNTKVDHKDPTCTEAGYDKLICLDCGITLDTTPIEKNGHGETRIDRLLPTCTEDGYIKEICTVCNEVVFEETLASSGHNYITDIKVPTCTEDGYVQRICPACQHVESKVTQPKTGHSWSEWKIIQQPTYSKNGVERRVCNNCGIDEERSVPKLVIKPTKLVMSMQEIGMNFKQTTRLFVNIEPEEAAYSTNIIWESSNPSVATVDEEGAVYAAGPGTATITAKTADGKLTATCEVTVTYSTLQWIIIYLLFGWIWYV